MISLAKTMKAGGTSALLGAALLVTAAIPVAALPDHQERRFTVKDRPVVVLQNIVNGRIEVKSWKNHEVVVSTTMASGKVNLDMEQVGDRIDIKASALTASTQPQEIEANFQLTVPEETELQLNTQTGLIYVEQVNGDMKLQSIAGDVHLKEVSGYIIVKTAGGSLICTVCSGKLDFSSISGGATITQPTLKSVNLITMTGNLLYDGDFVRTGVYTMNSTRGLVEVRFSGSDSFDLSARTTAGSVDNQAAAFLKPDSHGAATRGNTFRGIKGTVGQGLAKVELSSYSGTIRILKRN